MDMDASSSPSSSQESFGEKLRRKSLQSGGANLWAGAAAPAAAPVGKTRAEVQVDEETSQVKGSSRPECRLDQSRVREQSRQQDQGSSASTVAHPAALQFGAPAQSSLHTHTYRPKKVHLDAAAAELEAARFEGAIARIERWRQTRLEEEVKRLANRDEAENEASSGQQVPPAIQMSAGAALLEHRRGRSGRKGDKGTGEVVVGDAAGGEEGAGDELTVEPPFKVEIPSFLMKIDGDEAVGSRIVSSCTTRSQRAVGCAQSIL